jgi:hypothetical protein
VTEKYRPNDYVYQVREYNIPSQVNISRFTQAVLEQFTHSHRRQDKYKFQTAGLETDDRAIGLYLSVAGCTLALEKFQILISILHGHGLKVVPQNFAFFVLCVRT